MAGTDIDHIAVSPHSGREEPGTEGAFLIKGEPQHLRLLFAAKEPGFPMRPCRFPFVCSVFRSGILRRLYCKCLSVCIKILVEKAFVHLLWSPA